RAIFQTLTSVGKLSGHLLRSGRGSGGCSDAVGHHSRRLQGGQTLGHLLRSGGRSMRSGGRAIFQTLTSVGKLSGHLLRSGRGSGGCSDAVGHHSRRLQVWRTLGASAPLGRWLWSWLWSCSMRSGNLCGLLFKTLRKVVQSLFCIIFYTFVFLCAYLSKCVFIEKVCRHSFIFQMF
ncbi:MAG: hypothetical protein IKR89_10390, partial [Bacteroidaceae bacterium]|nr:hypothetical protein [Bacteroidaceae bacterium]